MIAGAWVRRALLCLTLVLLGCGGVLASDGDDAFTVIVLPDTQYYSQSYPHIFMAQTEWIAAMADELDIRLVLHAGDVVNTGARSEEQWINAKAALDILDQAGIPTFIAIGNHDYDDEARTRGAEKFNEYFGIERYEGADWFEGAFEEGRSENVYGLIEAGGIPFLVMALEFGPRRAVVEWANDVIASHPDRDVIVVTHAYMYYDDTRMSPGDHWNPKDYGVGAGVDGDATDGDDLWREVFSRHDNVRMILSGHVLGTGVGRRIDLGEAGNAVHQILANYQIRPQGGEGYLRIMRFVPSEGIVDVKSYSPYLDRYLEDETQQFVLAYDRGRTVPAEIAGRIVDAARGREIAGAVIATTGAGGAFYGVERSGADGDYSLRLPPGTYLLHVTSDGYLPQTVEIAAESAGPVEVDIALVPLPYAGITVGGVAPQIAEWTDRFAGAIDVEVEVGPLELEPSARIELARIVDGERILLQELYRGSEPPDRFVIDTTAMEDGTYEIAVEVHGMDGLIAVTAARFGVRNWEELVDDLLPPLQNAWFGEQSRKRTVAESPGWAYATDSPDDYFGDDSRLVRTGTGDAWLIWEAPKLHSFTATLYAADVGDVDSVVTVEVSPDGDSWTPVPFEHQVTGTSDAGWHRVEVTGVVGAMDAVRLAGAAGAADPGGAADAVGPGGVADSVGPRSAADPVGPAGLAGAADAVDAADATGTALGQIGAAYLRITVAGEEPPGVGVQLGRVSLLSYLADGTS